MKLLEDSFAYDVVVGYSALDGRATLRPSGLVALMQDSAIAHSTFIGYDLDWFRNCRRGWILLKWKVSFTRFPKENDQLRVHTWVRPFKRAQGQREYLIEDSHGNEIAYGTSVWVLMDFETRKPLKYTDDFFDIYYRPKERTFRVADPSKIKIAPIGESETPQQNTYVVTRRDIDFNGHVNNISYIDWAMDLIDDSVYYNNNLLEVNVEYKKECLPGTHVLSSCVAREKDDNCKELACIFSDKEDPSQVYCSISTVWEDPIA